jgi:hypothetical protein
LKIGWLTHSVFPTNSVNKHQMMTKNDGNQNYIDGEKYTVNYGGVPLFPNVSNVTIPAQSRSRFGMIQPNNIISECAFIGRLDSCKVSAFLVNIIDHLSARGL